VRSYGEVIDVRTTAPALAGAATEGGAGAPEQFLWRGRLYLVRDVLAHWVELGAWWVAPGRARRVDGTDGTGARVESGDAAAPRSVAADVGAVEREVWRVEAAPGRSASPGVYDLVRDVPAAYDAREPDDPAAPGMRPGGHRPDLPSRWRLARALD
jgi:hypothetical protein